MKEEPALAGFVLVGGSALSLIIGHRLSEDLDLIYPKVRLPRQRLEALLLKAKEAGFDFRANDDQAAVQEFADSSLELRDFQQDFLVDGVVKISFFTPDDAFRKIISQATETKVRVAALSELFKAKCLVSARRSKTRDWLDLFLLMRDHGFTIRDYCTTFDEAGSPEQCETGLTRLCSGVPQKDDEGYTHLLLNPPPLEELKSFFIAQRDKMEIETATEAKRRKMHKSSRPRPNRDRAS